MADTVRPAYVVEVRTGDADPLAFVGEVRATRRAELAFPVSGRVASVHAEVGDAVRAGQVLVRLDEAPLRAQLAVAAADVARAGTQLAEARARMARVEAARRADASSEAELGAARAEVGSAESALQGAVAQRDAAAWSLAHAVLRAPVDGVVATRTAEPGQASGPGTPLMTLDGAGRELAILVPAAMALEPGRAVVLRGPDGAVESRVLRSAGRLEAGGVRKVFLAVPPSAPVGSTWSAAIGPQVERAALQVPLRAVLPDTVQGRGHVLRIAADGRSTERVAVTLGAPRGDRIEVTGGLAAGDRIVVAGAAAIRPGMVVRPVADPREGRS